MKYHIKKVKSLAAFFSKHIVHLYFLLKYCLSFQNFLISGNFLKISNSDDHCPDDWSAGQNLVPTLECNQGGISSSVLSVFFTDKFALSQSDARISVAYNSCQWKALTNRLMKCPPGMEKSLKQRSDIWNVYQAYIKYTQVCESICEKKVRKCGFVKSEIRLKSELSHPCTHQPRQRLAWSPSGINQCLPGAPSMSDRCFTLSYAVADTNLM